MELESTDIEQEMKAVEKALLHAEKFGLEVEVITFALRAMRISPISIEEALDYAMTEWDI